ncbi:MAG: hypothetical protein HXY38_12245 [Chloroflexi bacterium]|nr:hypothetical protein [Chloroflexota bacterium]
MKKNHGLLFAIALVMTALACAIPGLPTGSVAPPTPDTRLEQMVAETVSAALQLTQPADSFAAEAFTPTPVPTVTKTPIPATEIGTTEETLLDKTADGSTTFIDLPAKYQVNIPTEWLPLRINGQEFLNAGLLPEAANPAIQRSLAAISGQDPNVFRLFMLDVNEEHIDGGFVTNINLVWDQQMEAVFVTDTDIQAIANVLPNSLKDSQVLGAEVKTSKNELPYGVITVQTPALTQEGARIVILQKLAYFDLPAGTLSITLSTTEKWQTTVEPSFEGILDSLIILE